MAEKKTMTLSSAKVSSRYPIVDDKRVHAIDDWFHEEVAKAHRRAQFRQEVQVINTITFILCLCIYL